MAEKDFKKLLEKTLADAGVKAEELKALIDSHSEEIEEIVGVHAAVVEADGKTISKLEEEIEELERALDEAGKNEGASKVVEDMTEELKKRSPKKGHHYESGHAGKGLIEVAD